jgi:hypothetical protein
MGYFYFSIWMGFLRLCKELGKLVCAEEVVLAAVEELAMPRRERTADFMRRMHSLALVMCMINSNLICRRSCEVMLSTYNFI